MYNIKVYNADNSYKFTLNIKKLEQELQFSANINSGQGECTLVLNYNFEENPLLATDLVKIFLGSKLIFTGIVQKKIRLIDNTNESIEIPLLGIGTIFSYVGFKQGGLYDFTKNQDPSQTIRDIIDYVNTIYPNIFSYNEESIIDYGTSVGIDFKSINCLNAIQNTAKTTNYGLYIDKTGIVYFQPKEIIPTHKLTIGKDIESIKLEEDTENIVNRLILTYKTGTKIYEDITSQSENLIREKFLTNTDLIDEASADEFGNNYILDNKDPIKKTQIVVNKNYDIESLNILNTIIVKNFKYQIENLKIVKYSYTNDKTTIDLEQFDSFGKELNI